MAAETTASGKLRLILVDHDRRLLDVACDEVQVPGSEGALGVLPGHTALIATLRVGEVMYRQGKAEHYLALGEGLVEIADDVVTVLTESAELPEEIDVAAAREAASQAEADVQAATGPEWAEAQARLEKAATRIHVAERVGLRDVRSHE